MFSLNEKLIEAEDKVTKLHSVPLEIADDMIGLLDSTDFFDKPDLNVTAEEYINSHRVIDISCKSGSLLYSCYSRFMLALRDVFPDRDDRELFILRYLLYGLCPDKRYLNLIRNTFYNNQKYDLFNELGNFYHYDFKEQSGVDSKEAKELLENMKFDVVCGNPPYNDDMYLDFVLLGHRLAKSYDLWITPAKFQNKKDNSKSVDKNTEFREHILPSISYIVYYPETKDIFDILNRGGLAYYLCNKVGFSSCTVVNKSKTCPVLNSSEVRSLSSGKCLLNFVNNLISSKVDVTDNLSLHIDTDKSPYGLVTKTNGTECKNNESDLLIRGSYGKSLGYIPRVDIKKGRDSIDRFKCITTAKSGGAEIYQLKDENIGQILGLNTLYKYSPSEICSGDYFVAFAGDETEVDSFISYMNTKFVNILYFAHCSNSNINELCFNLVPNQLWDKKYEDKPLEGYIPDKNGIYTDKDGVVHCSLYAKYKLTDEEINVIESVIRERK